MDILRNVNIEILSMMVEGNQTRPIDWDINNGWCEEWALLAITKLGGGVLVWPNDDLAAHCMVYLNGLYYDAQTLEGSAAFEKTPVFVGINREAWILNAS